jgi:hypothetical protein
VEVGVVHLGEKVDSPNEVVESIIMEGVREWRYLFSKSLVFRVVDCKVKWNTVR